jgi:alpha-amylase
MMQPRILAAALALAVAFVSACDDDPGTADQGQSDQGTDQAPGDQGDDPLPDTGDDPLAPDGDVIADATADADAADEPDLVPIGDPVTVPVGAVFPAGTAVRDAYGGDRAVVDAEGNLTLVRHPNGVLLLEHDRAPGREADFSWDNATVYFVVTDRFENGDPSNDQSYGRVPAPGQVVGTFHGGDLAGLTQRLDHLDALGVNAVWISPPYEQIHGWVGGGNGDFQHYAYRGYWALDFTRLDANFGTEDDLRTFVDAAHDRGIRVVFDVVMNHPGYGALDDLAAYVPEVLHGDYEGWTPGAGQNWHSWNELFVDFNNNGWSNWWGPQWIRADLPGHCQPGNDDLTRSLSFLPDFFTTVPSTCGPAQVPITALPVLLQRKTDTAAVYVAGHTVRDYLIDWLTHWVREYGIDGFRADTAKHVELAAWAELLGEARAALADWKAANPGEALDDLDFWAVAEVFPHAVVGSSYHLDAGFDSVLNFDFQTQAVTVANDFTALEALYADYAGKLNGQGVWNVLSYISSHDTHLYFERHGRDVARQLRVGTALLLLPGGIQIFYGDETGRRGGPAGSEPAQATTSDMNWDSLDRDLLWHWQRLGQFRNRHVAVGAGSHRALEYDGGTMFAREYEGDGFRDEVVVVLF